MRPSGHAEQTSPRRPQVVIAVRGFVVVGSPRLDVARRVEESLEVFVAGSACAQMRRDAGKLTLGSRAGEHELDVDVQNRERLLAPDVARIGRQEAFELRPVAHDDPPVSGSICPLATSDRRNLRRASNSDL